VAPEATEHARLAPSTFKQREVCPSYVPDEETTKAAERGTMLHGILERHGHSAMTSKDVKELEEGDFEQLQMIVDYTTPHELSAKQHKLPILREHKFDLRKLGITDCDKGTGDLIILDKKGKHVILMDYKLGWIEVDDAEYNIQTGIYGLGCFFEWPWAETVSIHILQPARDEVSTASITRANIPSILLRAKTIADRAVKKAGKEFNPVADNCLWCDNKASCLALHALVLKAAEGARLEVPDGVLTPEDFNDVANAGKVYDFAEVVLKWGAAIKWKIIELANEGTEVPDHELRHVSGKRSIIDPGGAQQLLEEQFNVPLEEFLAVSNPSITKIEALVSKHADQGVKGATAKEASSALMAEGIVASGNASCYLVRVKTKNK
jgi:hypothetical protein